MDSGTTAEPTGPQDSGTIDDPPTPTEPPTTTGTATTVVTAASCASTDNALRLRCEVEVAAPADVTLTLTAPSLPSRAFTAEIDAAGAIVAWGLAPATTYSWTIGGFSGQLATGALPAALDAASVVVEGATTGFDAVLYPLRCPGPDYFVMFDPGGQIVWYEANEVYFDSTFAGYDWSAESETLLTLGATRFQEQHVSGDVVLELTRGVDFDGTLHHDVSRWGDLRYLLYNEPVGAVEELDGIYVFDGAGDRIATFRLDDVFTLPPNADGDWAHVNAVKPSASGELVLSLHAFDAVLGIDGDPASPTFLQRTFLANGRPNGLPDPDYVAPSAAGEGFASQHNTSRVGDELWLFDNKGQPEPRAARLAMDATAGTLTVSGSWTMTDLDCPNQGGAVPLEDGGVLASCGNTGDVRRFQEGATEPEWSLRASCGEVGGVGTLPILRGIPVDLP